MDTMGARVEAAEKTAGEAEATVAVLATDKDKLKAQLSKLVSTFLFNLVIPLFKFKILI